MNIFTARPGAAWPGRARRGWARLGKARQGNYESRGRLTATIHFTKVDNLTA